MRHFIGSLALHTAVFTGCTSTAKISRSSNKIQEAAQASKERFEILAAEAPPPHNQTAVGGIEEQADIIERAKAIQTYLTGVEDKVPEWVILLQYTAIAAITIAVLLILWNTGIGTAIRSLLGWIPRKKQREADLAAAVLSDSSPVNVREYIAAKRASDRDFDKAYAKAQRSRT